MAQEGQTCGVCGRSLHKPRICRKCGGSFCNAHSSPAAHACPSACPVLKKGMKRKALLSLAAVTILAGVVIVLIALREERIPEPGPAWQGSVRYVDVTAGSGLGYSASGHGVAIDDLDGDLDLDVYLVNKGGNCFFRNNGDGTFSDLTNETGVGEGPGGGHGVAIGDYDNDGDRDIYSANWQDGAGSPNLLYRNEGGFKFTDITKTSGLDVGDPGRSHSACMGDFNGDGWLDIVATNVEGRNFYFQNRRDGSFLFSSDLGSGDAPHGLVASDYDKDGDLDLYLSNQAWGGNPASNVFYENRGNSFARRTTSVGLMGETHCSFFGDFDGDGDYDFFGVDRASEGAKAYYMNVGSRFRDVSQSVGAAGPKELVHGMDCADFDLDGDLDVLLTGGPETILLANRGGGHFEDVTSRVGLEINFGNPKAVCFFDYDDDGDLDLYVVVAGGTNFLFRCDGADSNWLKVNLEGGTSNRDGIGAHLEIICGDLVQHREVPAGRGHIHDPIEQHIGLGGAESVDAIRVRWPSGDVQEILDLPVNERILITEGEGWTSMG